ncbi:MAG: extracellular solute-binding protein [Lachnospiraceae bacterium]|nr:extracellular solute-binding protein [Lachnospiraceae bacterium]
MKGRKLGLLLCAGVICLVFAWFSLRSNGNETKEFTAFFAVPGVENPYESRIMKKIEALTGVKVTTEWLAGQTASEVIESMIAKGEYPDYINGSDAMDLLIEADALVPLEEYLDDYPYLKAYLTDKQWESLYKEDGHIYFIPPFGVYNQENTATMLSGEAFWIQKRVLEWADYPKLKTVDEYFDLILRYLEENPMTDGVKNIGFSILCEDWRYFCLENPPMFLAGYPNDGCAIVDSVTKKAHVYDTIPEAKQYYKKLNEMYNAKAIEPETFTLTFNQYIDKLSAGNVLGVVDQYWQILDAQNTLYASGREECTYVPFPITANENIEPKYNCREENLNVADGIAITRSCEDVEGALQFLNDLLSPEIMILRNWGEEGIDYCVDEEGYFYRSEEQRNNWSNGDYLKENRCSYTWFPCYEGMLTDGKNTVLPSEQPGEYYARLSDYDKKILDAYGHKTWKEFMGEEKEGEAWFPLYSCTADWLLDTAHGQALAKMEEIKRLWLPKIIMSKEEDFEKLWEEYMDIYAAEVDVKAYEKQLNKEIEKRIELNQK